MGFLWGFLTPLRNPNGMEDKSTCSETTDDNTVALRLQQTSCPWLWVPFKHTTENISTPPAWQGQTCLLQTVKHELLAFWFLILACQSSSTQTLMTTQLHSDSKVSFFFQLSIIFHRKKANTIKTSIANLWLKPVPCWSVLTTSSHFP